MTVEYSNGTESRQDIATTLGAGGLFIRTDEPLDEGTRISLRFVLPHSGAQHEIDGRVVWANRRFDTHDYACGMGIEFTQPDRVAQLARELD